MTTKTTILFGASILGGIALLIVLAAHLTGTGKERHDETPVAGPFDGQDIPEHLRPLVVEPQVPPQPDQLAQLREEDRAALLRLYEAASDLSQRRALVWALGHLGGAQVADRFIQALTDEFEHETLSDEQENTLCDTVRALGLVAATDDDAYAFVKRASEASFWEKGRLWESPRGDYADSLFTSYSIQAVALSGRPDAMPFLETLKARPRRYQHAFAGDVAQGAFYLHLRRKGGQPLLMQYMLSGDRTLFEEWIETEEGARWLNWANEQMRGPAPVE